MTISEQHISETTAFDHADKFVSEADVREYFTVENMRHMFGDEPTVDQAQLDEMAAAVIDGRWHCAF